MENILSFLDALGGLGAITHILVQDTVDKLHNGLLKKKITHDLDALSHKFDKEMNILKDNFKRETRIDGYKVHVLVHIFVMLPYIFHQFQNIRISSLFSTNK